MDTEWFLFVARVCVFVYALALRIRGWRPGKISFGSEEAQEHEHRQKSALRDAAVR